MRALADIAPTQFDVPAAFSDDPRRRYTPNWQALVAPRSVEEIQGVLEYARETQTPIVPFGGGTGLVGGQFFLGEGDGAIALSMRAFDDVVIDATSAVVGAGVVLERLHHRLEDSARHFPLSLASSGSAQIGGLIATNAGGVNVIRHGTMGQLVEGLSVVLPDGTLIDRTASLKKDNTGYALDRLQIGAEGTLGIITRARLRTVPVDRERHVVLLPVDDPHSALSLLNALSGLTLNAFELIAGTGLRFRLDAGFDPAPIGTPDWSVLFEIAEPLDRLAEIDWDWKSAITASDGRQIAAFWHIRETIPLANRHIGAIASHDIALPVEEIPSFLIEMQTRLDHRDLRINAFGHLGDGNLHYNLFPATGRNKTDYNAPELTDLVHRHVVELGGSISAEHGIGRYKAPMMKTYGYGDKLKAMRAIKTALDPQNILNPGVFFDVGIG